MLQTLARVHLRQLNSGRKLVMLLFLTGMPLAITVLRQLLSAGTLTDEEAFVDLVAYVYPVFCVFSTALVALVYGSSILNTEIDGKTLTYLFTRPIPKWMIIVAKYIGTVVFTGVPLLISLILSWVVLGMPHGFAAILALTLSMIVGLIARTGVFSAIGVIFQKHPVPVGIVYFLLIEVLFTLLPAMVNYFSVGYYQRSILIEVFDLGQVFNLWGRMLGEAPLVIALVVPVAIGALGVAIAAYLTTNRQFVETQGEAGA